MTGRPSTGACPPDEDLKAYVDGELGTLEAAGLRAHLNTCARCEEETSIMRQIGESVRSMEGAVEPPASLRGRVLSRLGFRPEGARRRPNAFDLLRFATAALFIAMFGALLVPMFGTARESARAPMATNERMATADQGAWSPGQPTVQLMQREPERVRRGSFEQPSAGAEIEAKVGAKGPTSTGAAGARPASNSFTPSLGQLPRGGAGEGEVTPDDVKRYSQGLEGQEFKRKVVQTATLGVRVNRKLEGVQDDVSAKVRGYGGYVESSNLTSEEKGIRVANMTLRVPVEKFDDALAYFATFGEVTAKNVSGEDVTGTWIDQRAEVREMRADEKRLLAEYEKAKTNEARWNARWQLLQLRPRMRAAEERFALTSKLAALSTVHLTLTEEPQARVRGNLLQDLDNMVRSALAAFLVAVRIPAAVLIWLVVFAPLWIPGAMLYRWATRQSRARQEQPSA